MRFLLWPKEHQGLHGSEGDPFLTMIDSGSFVGPGRVVPQEELPFETLDINSFAQEEDTKSICTGQSSWKLAICPMADRCSVDVWVIDLPDLRHTATLLK